MNNDICFFLPTRKGSQRVKSKNTRPFANIEGGLLEHKLRQLLEVDLITTIVLSTNDEDSVAIAKKLDPSGEKIEINIRPDSLCTSNTLVEDFIKYIPSIISQEHIFWVHATAPFIDASDYKSVLANYKQCLDEGYDSLLSVTRFQKFLWSKEENTIINCDRSINKWPNTQDLKPLYEINHAFYISSKQNYLKYNDRIGINPKLYELDHIKSFDIDWEDDFLIAEAIYEKLYK